MGDLVTLSVPKPWRRWLVVGGAAVLVVAAAYAAGRFSAPAKVTERTVTVEKSVRDEAAIAQAVAQAKAEWQRSVQDHTVTKTRTVYVEGKPSETTKIIYVDRDTESKGSSESSSAATVKAETHEAIERKTETVKVTESSLPGWALGASALWTPLHPSSMPSRAGLELERRLFGTIWLGATAQADLSTNPDLRVGLSARWEW